MANKKTKGGRVENHPKGLVGGGRYQQESVSVETGRETQGAGERKERRMKKLQRESVSYDRTPFSGEEKPGQREEVFRGLGPGQDI